eukprot:TRINITY_DN11340_c0_g1_i1.p1 TRINITY_DN11340_c0_g1~~TRINITY_DN11340_c0_g1_i1.p1  ORF type:complete len:490 (-),score=114.72 TRINITY_DN11340_c0_g1_i1:163-1632(-)
MPGIAFPKTEKGDRSTTTFNKAVYSAIAQKLADDALVQQINGEKDWRHQYHVHIDELTKRLLFAGCQSKDAAVAALQAGLEEARKMDFENADGSFVALQDAVAAAAFDVAKIQGTGTPETTLTCPYKGRRLTGEVLAEQCDAWATKGVMEPDCAQSIKDGVQKIDSLKGRTFVVLGAGSELGPLRLLLQAGATVAAVATRKPKRWAELIEFTKGTAGTLLLPVPQGKTEEAEAANVAGADLTEETPAILDWCVRVAKEAPGMVTVGTYLYADGEANVRLTVASDMIVDKITQELGASKASCAWLTSCSTSLVIPDAAFEAQQQILKEKTSWWQRGLGSPNKCEAVATESKGSVRFYKGFEVLQGPNYALAQLMRQWRAMILASAGYVVSAPVTPSCHTESVRKNSTMAAVLDGMAYQEPLEAFEPDACQSLMFAVLVSDLSEPVPELASPQHLFARKSFHSGLWRCPFAMSSLGSAMWVLGKVAGKRSP